MGQKDQNKSHAKEQISLKEKVKKLIKRKNLNQDVEKNADEEKDSKLGKRKNPEAENKEGEPDQSKASNAFNDHHPNLENSRSSKSWQELNLIKPLLKSVSENGYDFPTYIQEMAIPVINSGRDVLASSVTGSGKTAAFLLPILQKYYKIKYSMSLTNYVK